MEISGKVRRVNEEEAVITINILGRTKILRKKLKQEEPPENVLPFTGQPSEPLE